MARDTTETPAGENPLSAAEIAPALLAWYDTARRDLPWRAAPGVRPDPYAVWLSEVMLQQTTVKAVAPYYAKFLKLWPTVEALAEAELDAVLAAWAGLGYYSRARNLHRCAQEVVTCHGGRFPESEAALLDLPGIGPYTAAAIAAIAFDRPATVVDGNVERVVARLHAVEEPLPGAKASLRRLAETLTPEARPGDYAQAMMDLGATLCTPKSPSCMLCPLSDPCRARALGIQATLPVKMAKGEKPRRRGTAYFALTAEGQVLLRRRPESGLLGGMMEVPSSPWVAAEGAAGDPLADTPLRAEWSRLTGEVRHTFTHFHLELAVYAARLPASAAPNGADGSEDWRWVHRRDLGDQALPSLMRKVVAHAFEGLGEKESAP